MRLKFASAKAAAAAFLKFAVENAGPIVFIGEYLFTAKTSHSLSAEAQLLLSALAYYCSELSDQDKNTRY